VRMLLVNVDFVVDRRNLARDRGCVKLGWPSAGNISRLSCADPVGSEVCLIRAYLNTNIPVSCEMRP
jgi:hypothetical protein